LIPLRVERPAPYGPYCCFSGRAIRPWHRRLLFGLVWLWTALLLPLYLLELLQQTVPAGPLLALCLGASVLFLASLVSPTLSALSLGVSLALALRAAIVAFGVERPLDLGQWPDVGTTLRGAFEASDEFLAQAARTNTFSVLALLHLALLALPCATLVSNLIASHQLPRRLWFARYHPVWRRPYRLERSPHPLLGLLYVARDPLLAEKLIWLRLERTSDALCIGARGPQERAAAPRIPLAEQLGDLVLFREGRQWHASGPIPSGGHAELRPLLVPLHPAGRMAVGVRRYQDVDGLPVRDLFADENSLFGKRLLPGRSAAPFGVLLDSRPEPGPGESQLPRFVVLLEQQGELSCQYGHPDLDATSALAFDGHRARIPWRTADGGRRLLELERGVDSVHAIGTPGAGYHLLFLAFGGGNP
jgi:hypothetical protein